MKRQILLLFFSCLMGVALMVSCTGPGVGTKTCGSDADCTDGFCIDGLCQGGCKNDADCPAGGTCNRGACISSGCQKNSQCKNGTVCADNACVPCRNDGQCNTEGGSRVCVGGVCKEGDCHGSGSSCPDGKVCIEFKCTACSKDEECSGGLICKESKCQEGCRTNENCAKGKVCDTSDNACKECVASTDCTDSVCDTSDNTCKECLADTDCKICQSNKCTACAEDKQCGSGKLCVNSACTEAECKDNAGCKDGKICQSNKCVPCTADRDCAAGSLCVSGACKAGDCKDSKDCSNGKICKNNRCSTCTADTDCPSGQVCANNSCRAGCRKDGDCQNNQKCDPQALVCKGCIKNADCPAGQICRQSQCIGCSSKSDCPSDSVCVNGLCQKGDCTANKECAQGQVCLNYNCLPCTKDGDCDSGQICDAGNKRCRAGCRQSSDCQNEPVKKICDTSKAACHQCAENKHCALSGQVCVNNTCQNCLRDGDCDSGLICDFNTKKCREGCRKNTDCSNGKICDTQEALCRECLKLEHCQNGKVCRKFICDNCLSDLDCGSNKKICDTNTKLCKDGCRLDSQCASGQICNAGTDLCVTGCRKDEDCPSGVLCLGNKCATGCRTNTDCAGQICQNNKCTACISDPQCGSGKICKAGKCEPGCRTDAQCGGSGQRCDPADNKCKGCINNSDCATGQVCKNNQCGSCQTNAECGATGWVCLTNGTCVQGNCSDSSDCNKQVCVDNKCAACLTNDPKYACPTGQICVSGKCESGNCSDNSQCGNLVCKNFTCSACSTDAECGGTANNRLCDITGSKTCFAGNCRKHDDCPGAAPTGQICVSNQCSACPSINLTVSGATDALIGRIFNLYVSFTPNNAFPSSTQWKLLGAPTWLKVLKVNEYDANINGTPTASGDFTFRVEVGVGKCLRRKSITIKVWPLLESMVNPFLNGTSGVQVVNAGTTIKGGKPPYSCGFFNQRGGGTVPAGVTLGGDSSNIVSSGCSLTGTPNTTNKPGRYGFLMVVQDSFLQQVVIPVGYKVGTCQDNNSLHINLPTSQTLPVKSPGTDYNFEMKLNDIDRYLNNSTCFHSINLSFGATPLNTGTNLSCAGSEPVCVECTSTQGFCTNVPTSCPSTVTSRQYIKVRKHTPIITTSPKGPAFLTLEANYTYSLNKAKSCHIDVLERD